MELFITVDIEAAVNTDAAAFLVVVVGVGRGIVIDQPVAIAALKHRAQPRGGQASRLASRLAARC